jgi:secondary thiamine-phosphate synthase enzyme
MKYLLRYRRFRASKSESFTYSVITPSLLVMHTSASITLNENADPSVRVDMESSVNRMVPEGPHYTHDYEGDDDMPAHVKTSLLGSSVSIPIANGRLAMGYKLLM